MSTTTISTTSDLIQEPPVPQRRKRWSRRRLLGAVAGLVAAVALAGGIVNLALPVSEAILPTANVVAPQGLATLPDTPINGVLTLDIPLGASADQQAGGRGYAMPSVINLEVGDTIVIHNNDDAPHMILYTFLLPGQTDTRTFTAPGSEVYSSGCGLHAAAILNFTTIFVHAPAAGSA